MRLKAAVHYIGGNTLEWREHSPEMTILGIGGLLSDAACAVLKNGELKAAVEEIKVTRGFRPGQMPEASMSECLRLAGATANDVECVAIARPFARGPESIFHLALRHQFPN